MTPEELANGSYAFFEKVLWEAYDRRNEKGDVREAFIFRHGRNVQAIARDVFFLFSEERYAAATIAIRSMIESMFCVVASLKIASFPEEKIIAECEKMVQRISRLSQDKSIGDMTEAIETHKTLASNLRQQYSVTTNNDWNVFNVAKAGKLEGHYSTDYFLHCGYVHATVSGIISQENNAALGHSFQTAIATVIITAGHLAMKLETQTPQAHVDNSARLLHLLLGMMQQGVFRDEDEPSH